MSGIVKNVKKLFSSDNTKQAFAVESQKQAQAQAQAQARVATPEEKAVALRRRRGARALLSQERMDAEAGLAGEQTTLGGM